MLFLPTGQTFKKNSYPFSVSAVTVNYNGGDRLATCIDKLLSQDMPLTEIIVIDNGSNDGSIELLRRANARVKVIELNENIGLPAARNIGIRQAVSEFILLIDNDIYVAEDCSERLLQSLLKHGGDVICPRIILYPACKTIQCEGAAAHFIGTMTLRHSGLPIEEAKEHVSSIGACIGACIFISRAAAIKTGGFNEDYFFYFEDLEFSLRLRSLGYTILFESSALVFHDQGSGTKGLSFRGKGEYPVKRAYLNIRNRVMTLLIHYRMRTLFLLSPALLIYELATIAICFRRGWTMAWINAWCWHFKHRHRINHKRSIIQANRIKDDRDFLEGGILPFSHGFARSKSEEKGIRLLSTIFNFYWYLTKSKLG